MMTDPPPGPHPGTGRAHAPSRDLVTARPEPAGR